MIPFMDPKPIITLITPTNNNSNFKLELMSWRQQKLKENVRKRRLLLLRNKPKKNKLEKREKPPKLLLKLRKKKKKESQKKREKRKLLKRRDLLMRLLLRRPDLKNNWLMPIRMTQNTLLLEKNS